MASEKQRRGFFDAWLEQEITPVFTAASVVTTFIGWMIITTALLYLPRDHGDLVAGLPEGFAVLFVLFGGSVVNWIIGWIAKLRAEYCGARIAAFGIGLGFVTVAVFWHARR